MPPATRPVPLDSSVAVWRQRGTFMLAAGLQRPVDGSYSSAVVPPAARTRPSFIVVSVRLSWTAAMSAVAAHVPVAAAADDGIAKTAATSTAESGHKLFLPGHIVLSFESNAVAFIEAAPAPRGPFPANRVDKPSARQLNGRAEARVRPCRCRGGEHGDFSGAA